MPVSPVRRRIVCIISDEGSVVSSNLDFTVLASELTTIDTLDVHLPVSTVKISLCQEADVSGWLWGRSRIGSGIRSRIRGRIRLGIGLRIRLRGRIGSGIRCRVWSRLRSWDILNRTLRLHSHVCDGEFAGTASTCGLSLLLLKILAACRVVPRCGNKSHPAFNTLIKGNKVVLAVGLESDLSTLLSQSSSELPESGVVSSCNELVVHIELLICINGSTARSIARVSEGVSHAEDTL